MKCEVEERIKHEPASLGSFVQGDGQLHPRPESGDVGE